MWCWHFDFLPQIEDNFTTTQILLFIITSFLFGINLKLAGVRNSFYANVGLSFFLVISYHLYWNIYAFLMRPHVDYFFSPAWYLIGHLVWGLIGTSISFVLMKIINRLYENYHHRA
jgi:hypothetical protein